MATLRDSQRRIRSVQSTQKITKAMKLVAASKFRRAQERILAARPYATKMDALMGRPAEASVTLGVVGKKARDFSRRRQFTVKTEMLGFFDRLAYSHARELAGGLMQDYLAEEVDEVHLMYNEFRSVAVQRPVRQQLLPIEAEDGGGDGAGPQEEYLYEPGPEAILDSLLPRHVTTQVFRALMESVAGEYGARMTAMESATKNAREMINLLTIQYNKARQERITKELLDIVGGAEALRQSVNA